jgi:hypothetical protein
MRTIIVVTALAAALSGISLAAHAADGVPKFDVAKNCKAEVTEGSGIGETIDSCTRDEEQARQQLIAQWDRFSREDKLACIRETAIDGSPSYVELQTCVELANDTKALRKDDQK